MTSPLGLPDVYVPTEEGYFVSESHARIAEIISDYDPTLRLAWIPPDKREAGDQPFAVIHAPLGRPEYIVCYADDANEALLERIFSMDSTKNDVWSQIERSQAAAEAVKMKKKMDEMEEAKDLTTSIIKSKKHVYRHDGVTYQ